MLRLLKRLLITLFLLGATGAITVIAFNLSAIRQGQSVKCYNRFTY